MRVIVAFCLVILSSLVCAEAQFPAGCKPIEVKGEEAILDVKNGKLAFIHNTSSADLWITHPVQNPGASAGWTSNLQANNWSAIFIYNGTFAIACVESKPGHEQNIPCKDAITVCQWDDAKSPNNVKSTIWVGENKSLDDLMIGVQAERYIVQSDKK